MKIKLAISFLLLVVLIMAPLVVYAEGDGGLHFEKTLHDFKERKEGDILTFTFKATNESAKPITVKRVITNCSCITAEVSTEKVAPRQACTVSVRLDTTKRIGELLKRVYLHTDSTITPAISLTLQASVKKKSHSWLAKLRNLFPLKKRNQSTSEM